MDETPPATGVTLYRPTIVGLLYLLNIFLGFSVFVGVVLAYIWRGEPETQDWEKTHYTYLIRTFWVGLVLVLGTFVLFFASVFGVALNAEAGGGEPHAAGFVAGMFGWIAVWMLAAIWFCARTILSLVKAGKRQPMPNPGTWLF